MASAAGGSDAGGGDRCPSGENGTTRVGHPSKKKPSSIRVAVRGHVTKMSFSVAHKWIINGLLLAPSVLRVVTCIYAVISTELLAPTKNYSSRYGAMHPYNFSNKLFKSDSSLKDVLFSVPWLIKHQYISACIANKICRPIKAKADRCMKARHVSTYIILVANKQVLFVSICARTPNIISWKQIKFGVYASSPWLA